MLETTHSEAVHAAADPRDQDDREAVPDSDQMVQDAQQEQQQQQPEAMQEDLVKPIARPVRLQDGLQGAQGTPKAVASTLVSFTACQHPDTGVFVVQMLCTSHGA